MPGCYKHLGWLFLETSPAPQCDRNRGYVTQFCLRSRACSSTVSPEMQCVLDHGVRNRQYSIAGSINISQKQPSFALILRPAFKTPFEDPLSFETAPGVIHAIRVRRRSWSWLGQPSPLAELRALTMDFVSCQEVLRPADPSPALCACCRVSDLAADMLPSLGVGAVFESSGHAKISQTPSKRRQRRSCARHPLTAHQLHPSASGIELPAVSERLGHSRSWLPRPSTLTQSLDGTKRRQEVGRISTGTQATWTKRKSVNRPPASPTTGNETNAERA
jgi:hypothetical protein